MPASRCAAALLLFSRFACAGAELPQPYAVMDISSAPMKTGNVLAPLLELESREKEYFNSPLKPVFVQAIGTLHSYVGDYAQALRYFDMGSSVPEQKEPSLEGLTAEPAIEAIATKARTAQVILINEAHHVPQHRAFTLRLLKDLRGLGFRYFAAETLYEGDKELNSRGYPLWNQTGYLTNEPLYGDIIRQALKLGYKVVPYENAPRGCKDKPGEPMYCQNLRERGQAEYLKARIFAQDPKAKVVVHVGYGHHDRIGSSAGWHPMGRYLIEMTGLDPLVVDQTEMTEHSEPKFEKPEYRAALRKFNFENPIVLRTQQGGFWVSSMQQGHYDVQVFHPRSRYSRGRPDWILLDGARRLVSVPQDACGRKRPCLIQVYAESEGESAVPMDQIVLEVNSRPKALALPSGRFTVRAMDQGGNILSRSPLNVP